MPKLKLKTPRFEELLGPEFCSGAEIETDDYLLAYRLATTSLAEWLDGPGYLGPDFGTLRTMLGSVGHELANILLDIRLEEARMHFLTYFTKPTLHETDLDKCAEELKDFGEDG